MRTNEKKSEYIQPHLHINIFEIYHPVGDIPVNFRVSVGELVAVSLGECGDN